MTERELWSSRVLPRAAVPPVVGTWYSSRGILLVCRDGSACEVLRSCCWMFEILLLASRWLVGTRVCQAELGGEGCWSVAICYSEV